MQAAGEDSLLSAGPGKRPAGPWLLGSPGEVALRVEARCLRWAWDFLQNPVSVGLAATVSASDASPSSGRESHSHRAAPMLCPVSWVPSGWSAFRAQQAAGQLRTGVAGPGARSFGARLWEAGEELTRFCEEDQEVLCWVCDTTLEHRSHHTTLLQEAARCYHG